MEENVRTNNNVFDSFDMPQRKERYMSIENLPTSISKNLSAVKCGTPQQLHSDTSAGKIDTMNFSVSKSGEIAAP